MIKNEQQRKRIGQDITRLREQLGMTQGDVSKHTGILRQHISRIEQGKYSVGFDTLQAIANALDADIHIVPRNS